MLLPISGFGSARVNQNTQICIFGLNQNIHLNYQIKAFKISHNIRKWINQQCFSNDRYWCEFHRNLGPVSISIRCLSVGSHKVSKARDRVLECSYRFEIWQAHRHPAQSDNSKYKFLGFETLWDLIIRLEYPYNCASASKEEWISSTKAFQNVFHIFEIPELTRILNNILSSIIPLTQSVQTFLLCYLYMLTPRSP